MISLCTVSLRALVYYLVHSFVGLSSSISQCTEPIRTYLLVTVVLTPYGAFYQTMSLCCILISILPCVISMHSVYCFLRSEYPFGLRLIPGKSNSWKFIVSIFMDNTRNNKILFWNIRGINSQEKWDTLRDKINESAYQIIYIQETKREFFLISFTLKSYVLELWTFLPFLHRLVPWEGSLLLGIAVCSMVWWFNQILLPSQLNFSAGWTMKLFMSAMFMDLLDYLRS